MKRDRKSLLIAAVQTLIATPIAFWLSICWLVSSWPDPGSLIFGNWYFFTNKWLVGLGLDFLIVFAAVFGSIRGACWLIKKRWSGGAAVPA